MKSLYLNFVFVLTVHFGLSQNPVYTLGNSPLDKPQGCYLKDNNHVLDKFVGTWKCVQNNKSFTITLAKAEQVLLRTYYTDELQGQYTYLDLLNNSLLFDTSNYTGRQSKLTSGRLIYNDPNSIEIYYSDMLRTYVNYEGLLTYSIVNGVEQLHWELHISGVWSLPAGTTNFEPYIQDYQVPKVCDLIKQ